MISAFSYTCTRSKRYHLFGILIIFTLVLGVGCQEEKEEVPTNVSIDDIAGNEKVKKYMVAFEGRGVVSDSSVTISAEKALEKFTFSEDLEMDLVLSEPRIHQPLDISFDHRGRMWVVQYNQYPYPKGVKIVDIDNHLRAVFDKVPKPPGEGVKGADKITIFEDTNSDGTYDKSTDAITGLNITTGVTLGRKKIWVLTPPYLVAYPDNDGDGLPDGTPEVHLDGFGLEDTHAVANNLRWGPDGWLYGAQGSTSTATINSEVSKNVHFKGQAIWRYHPETKVFEIFGEGGGNTFDVEIDAKGRVYSGDNGHARGYFYKQGGYYSKNWGKHGALTNRYAFGYLPGMALKGEKMRFTHAWIKYEGDGLPKKYNEKIVAINPLHNYVQLTRLEAAGSTFLNVDEEKILETEDRWFRPVDIKAGPDGGIYIADWNDSRLSHVDPMDTWNKTTGRIYRLRGKKSAKLPAFDLSEYSNQELVEVLKNKNKWFRQQALVQFGNRKDASIVPELVILLKSGDGQTALEALWAINLSGGFTDTVATWAMENQDPYVRLWAVRLIGDDREASPEISKKLFALASSEKNLEVLGQLASTAKRLPGKHAFPIIESLLNNDAIGTDTEIQMFIWWAVEAKAETDRKMLLALFKSKSLWERPIVKGVILERLMQRYMLPGGNQNYLAGATLLDHVPSEEHAKILMKGLHEGLRGRDISGLPEELTAEMQKYEGKFGGGKLNLAIRQNRPEAIKKALGIIADSDSDRSERLVYVRAFGETNRPQAVPVLLNTAVNDNEAVSVRMASLQSLRGYDIDSIGSFLAGRYQFNLRSNLDMRSAALQLFSSRANWAADFLSKVEETKEVSKREVPLAVIRQFKLLEDNDVNAIVDRIWPDVLLVSSEEKNKALSAIKDALISESGNSANGKTIYQNLCGTCHMLKGEGASIGPDLTGYDRRDVNTFALNIVDPNADIREGYVMYRIKKKDGQVIAGILTDRDGGTVTVNPIGGNEIILSTNEVEEMVAQKTSIMPERLTENLSDQELRDLFAYIQG